MKSSNKNKPHILSWLLKLVETIKNKNKSPETYSGSVQGNIILSVTDWFPLPLEAMIRMIAVYIGCKRYMWPDMGHTHQPTGLPYQACIINHCKEWELLICSEHNVEFSISRQVKLYNPETRRNQKYLTGKHPHSQNICFVARSTWCSYLVSTPLKFSPGRVWSSALLVVLLRVVCQAHSAAQGQLEATLISFADPGGQCSEASEGNGAWQSLACAPSLSKSSAEKGGVGVRGRLWIRWRVGIWGTARTGLTRVRVKEGGEGCDVFF